jgi:hypothetical protein
MSHIRVKSFAQPCVDRIKFLLVKTGLGVML